MYSVKSKLNKNGINDLLNEMRELSFIDQYLNILRGLFLIQSCFHNPSF
jgi:hypothetical protein